MTLFKKATVATVLAATALTSVTPAMAQSYPRQYRGHGGGDATGAAIVGGVIGLALGAIIASSGRNNHNRYADRGWQWRDGYYWDGQGRRYYEDGRPCEEGNYRGQVQGGQGYYNRRGYNDRGYGQNDRGYYGRDQYYGQQNYRYGY